tara:strand:- start:591 stop:1622 length:1032 start_codon:yes stop_codon:yes gene_type:complete
MKLISVISILSIFINTSFASVNEFVLMKHMNIDIDVFHKFVNFKNKYNKDYKTYDEIFNSYYNFVDNYNFIKNYNSTTHTLEMNEYSDMSSDQFVNLKRLSKIFKLQSLKATRCNEFTSTTNSLPESIDWREKAVTSVKDQGQCGSCWSFSSAGAMEGAHAVATGELLDISEQQLMDCSWKYGDFGCSGGLMDNAFEYAIDNGMCLEKDVPYLGENKKCNEMPTCNIVAYFSSCFDVTPNDQVHLKEAVSFQPVSVAIEADTRVFQFYSSGIIDSSDCGTQLDHGVLIVGYGEDNGNKYWIVKNSWGSDWGEDGYVRIARSENSNDPGICGIAMQPSYIVSYT